MSGGHHEYHIWYLFMIYTFNFATFYFQAKYKPCNIKMPTNIKESTVFTEV